MADLAAFLHAVDPASSQPLYQQLQRALAKAIQSGALGPEDALPSERQLAAELGLSRITVRKAITGLADQGLLVRRHGSGNFVNARIEKQLTVLSSFSEDMRARGRVPGSQWLQKQAGQVTPGEALRLGLSPGSKVYRFARLRLADERPMALESCTVPGHALPSVDAVSTSLYEALERSGKRPVRALQRLSAVLLDDTQARRLKTEAGAAGLLVERVGYLRDGSAVELSHSCYRGDTYDFVAELGSA